MLLKDQVALVTGSSRGIGRAIALAMAREGAHVVVNYLGNEEKAHELCQEIIDMGSRAVAVRGDVSNWEEAADLIQTTIDTLGKIDILVNNAGVTRDNLLLRMKPADWHQVIGTNLTGAFNCTKLAIKPMIKQKAGRIINISSVSGLMGNPGQSNYGAAKAGLIGFTKAVAKEVASRNILVNAIAPGFIATDMTEKLDEEQQKNLLATIPLGRLGKPEEIAAMAVFLASPKGGYITGQTIVIDGGMVV